MKKVIRKITDVVTIVGPAVSSILVALGMTDVLPIFETWYGVTLIALGALSSVASVIYNQVTTIVED